MSLVDNSTFRFKLWRMQRIGLLFIFRSGQESAQDVLNWDPIRAVALLVCSQLEPSEI